MAVLKLTKSAVDRLRASDTTAFYWDAELKGFGIKVTPNGVRSWVAQYRPEGGRRSLARRVTIGQFPALTVDQARREAKKLLGAAAAGSDPAASRTEYRKAETIAEAWALYRDELAAHAKPSTVREWDRLAAREILPTFGTVRVRDLSTAQVARWHTGMRERPYLANRALEVVRVLLRWCITSGQRPDRVNPATDVTRYKEKPKERYLSRDELARLHRTLTLAETAGIPPATKYRKALTRATARRATAGAPRVLDPIGVRAIRFLALSGFREGEALSLKWSYLDLDAGVAHLPDTKSGASKRRLAQPTRDLLAALWEARTSDEWVFPGAKLGTHRVELRRIWDAVREHAQLEDVRLHDLRHTVAAIAAAAGTSLPLMGGLLGHKDARSTERYAHLMDEALQAVAERTAGDIQAAMEGRQTPAVPLRKKVKR